MVWRPSGAHLRRIHGVGTKRNIKFDEEHDSFYMDVLVPNQEEWLRVSPQMAKRERETSREEDERKTTRRLRAPLAPPAIASNQGTGANAVPATTRLPAGQPLIGGYTGMTPNFTADMEKISKKYSGMSASDRNKQRVYTSPKKNV